MTFEYIHIFWLGICKNTYFLYVTNMYLCNHFLGKIMYFKYHNRKNAFVRNLKNPMNQVFLWFSYT